MIFDISTPNGRAPLKSDWYEATNPLKICSFGRSLLKHYVKEIT